MEKHITVEKWTKEKVTRETHRIPPWTTPIMEMSELVERLREEQREGRIAGYEVRMEGARSLPQA